jgi:hypothetical protein
MVGPSHPGVYHPSTPFWHIEIRDRRLQQLLAQLKVPTECRLSLWAGSSERCFENDYDGEVYTGSNQVVHIGSGVGYLRHCSPRGAGLSPPACPHSCGNQPGDSRPVSVPPPRSNHSEGTRRAAGGKLRCPLWWCRYNRRAPAKTACHRSHLSSEPRKMCATALLIGCPVIRS